MAPRTLTYTVALVAAWVSKAAPEYAPFGLPAQLAWYHHTKSGCFGSGYHHKRFGNVKAAVSRNNREGKLIGVYKGQLVRNFGNRLFTNDANPSAYRAMHGLRRRRYARGDFES